MSTGRKVIGIERRDRSTLLKLECGHDRSIGGHVLPDGRDVASLSERELRFYICADGHCGGMPA